MHFPFSTLVALDKSNPAMEGLNHALSQRSSREEESPKAMLHRFVSRIVCIKDLIGYSSLRRKMKEVLEATNGFLRAPRKFLNCRSICGPLFIWLTMNLCVLFCQNMLVFGHKLWKWNLLFYMVSFGYPLINIVTWLAVHFMCNNSWVKRQSKWVYFIKGMRQSTNLVLFSSSLFLTWSLYLRTSHETKKTDGTGKLLHLLTSSFVTLMVAAVLWGFKTLLILICEAYVLLGLYCPMIVGAKSAVFLRKHVFFPELGTCQAQSVNYHQMMQGITQDHCQDSVESVIQVGAKGRMSCHNNLYEMKKLCNCIINCVSKVSSGKYNRANIPSQCQKINPVNDANYCGTADNLCSTCNMNLDHAINVRSPLKRDPNQNTITYADFSQSMVKEYENCVALGHTLSDAREVVKVLSNVMNGYLLAIVFMEWLILSDIVTTKILVLVAFSIPAATLAFRKTYKMKIEGIVFWLIKHPFNVGDRCIINGRELEVKRMSLLSTTFIVTKTSEEEQWSNSILSSEPIINLRG